MTRNQLCVVTYGLGFAFSIAAWWAFSFSVWWAVCRWALE